MIERVWHGTTSEAVADSYLEYIRQTGFPGLKSTPGNLGVLVLRHAKNGKVHFLVVSFWESFEAISQFSRLNIEKARYYPDDEKYLLEMEPEVMHYEVIAGQEMFFK